MTIGNIQAIKEELSNKFWGKSADEINNMIKSNVDDMNRRITELRQKREEKHAI